jgi:L-asparaginase II
MSEELVRVFRGNMVESVHRGSIAVVSSQKGIIYGIGNADRITYFRSTEKPLQAIAALETGIVEEYGLDLKEVAIMTASHSGEEEHISTLIEFMKKTGIKEDDLQCGIHDPVNKEAAKRLVVQGIQPSKLHCNCSGKHIGQLASIKLKGLNFDGYLERNHKMQKEIKRIVSEFSGTAISEILEATDGCGITVHAVPLKNIALSYANLCNEEFMEGQYKKSQNYIASSMTMYPEMVAGKGRLDTAIMDRFGDRVISKIGAEGTYAAGIIGKSIGIAIKIEDGNSRAVGPAILETLMQIGIISEDEVVQLKSHWNPGVYNHKNELVGEIKATFKLGKG